MEQKKQLLIKVLTKLQPYRNLADGILALVENNYIDEKKIDGIIRMLSISMKNIQNTKKSNIFRKGLKAVKKIREQENKEKMSEDVESILDTIE